MDTSFEQGTLLTPVAVKIGDRTIEFRGVHGDLYLAFTTTECVQCNTPYWNFSDYNLFNDFVNNRLGGLGIFDRTGSGVDVDKAGNPNYLFLLNPYYQALCTPECAERWFNSWPAIIKSGSDAKVAAQKIVGSEDYDIGEVHIITPYGKKDGQYQSPFWSVSLSNIVGGNYDLRRQIHIGVGGNVFRDINYSP